MNRITSLKSWMLAGKVSYSLFLTNSHKWKLRRERTEDREGYVIA